MSATSQKIPYAQKQRITLAAGHKRGAHDGQPLVHACPLCNPSAPYVRSTVEIIDGAIVLDEDEAQ